MTSLRSLTTLSLRVSALLLVGLALPLAGCSTTLPASTTAPAVAPVTSEAATPTPSVTTASAAPTPTPTPTPTNTSAPAKPGASGYTMAQVRQHSSAKSCWTVVGGNVYDLTKWINRHPGGPARILGMCGTDATAAFRAQHGTGGRANQVLAGYKLGKLA